MRFLYLFVLAEKRKSCIQYYPLPEQPYNTTRSEIWEKIVYQLQKLVKNPLRTAPALTQQKNTKTAR